jgi:hypothetical protein
MSMTVSTVAALGTVAAFVYGLVHLEQTAPFAQKPSIALLAWTGALPAADLPRVLEETTRELEVAKAAKAGTQAAVTAHREVGRTMSEHLQQLQTRITEKQAGQWSSLPQ